MKNYRKYFLLFLLFYYDFLFSLTISEIFYETSDSKYYNQVVEIYNNSPNSIKLTDYFFTNAEKTNKIILLSASAQKDFAFLNGIFTNHYLAPNQVAIIIDSGYKREADYDFNNSLIFTVNTSSLSSGRFLKEDEVIHLFDKNSILVDSWELIPVLPDESLVKIDFTRLGKRNNLLPITPNLGVIKKLNGTSDLPTNIILKEVRAAPQIIGIPQNYRFECVKNGVLAFSCNQEIQLKSYETVMTKLYFYYKGSNNLIDPEDSIPLNAGVSSPLTLWPLNTGTITFAYKKNLFPNVDLKINDFDSSLKDTLFINEIFYNSTNKNLVWLEIYSSSTVSTALEIYIWNSDFRFKKAIPIPQKTYQANTYKIFAYNNPDFAKEFNWHDEVIDTGEIINITAKGVIALKNDSGYIDSVYYQKDWFNDYIEGRSLQRKTTDGYAFTKDSFTISLDKNMTPRAKNDFSKNIYFTATLKNTMITRDKEHIDIALDYGINGKLTIFIYDPDDSLMGRVFYIEELSQLEEAKKINLCLTKANLIITGTYNLVFIYETDYGKKKITKHFSYQN